MARIEKTVFISYRRTDVYIALAVYDNLTRNGYDVFFDYKSIPSGDFEQTIISNIKARAHFLIILAPNALDRCSEPGDWLRREIETAMEERRNIIPLFFKGFKFGSEGVSGKLTGKLSLLGRYNGLNIHEDYFDAGMERLRTQFLNIPLDAVLHPVPENVRKIVQNNQTAANQALLREDVKVKIRSMDIHVGVDPHAPPPAKVPMEKIGGIEFIKIPHGEFIMGSRDDHPLAFPEEKPQHGLEIPYDYLISRFPVTNKQFAEFVTDRHYSTLAERQGFGVVYVNGNWRRVEDVSWQCPQGPGSNSAGPASLHPVVQVAWEDGLKYYEWLNHLYGNELGGLTFRAPTEAEWEKAARGTDGRDWPWGNEFVSANCNSKEGGIDCTTPVGSYFSTGDSPFGVSDMSGNVWEWTASLWQKNGSFSPFTYPYTFRDGRETMSNADAPHVLRGGSFRTPSSFCRVAYRERFKSIQDRNDNCGLRIVIGPGLP